MLTTSLLFVLYVWGKGIFVANRSIVVILKYMATNKNTIFKHDLLLQTELSLRLTIHAENQGIRKKTISVFMCTWKGLHVL